MRHPWTVVTLGYVRAAFGKWDYFLAWTYLKSVLYSKTPVSEVKPVTCRTLLVSQSAGNSPPKGNTWIFPILLEV